MTALLLVLAATAFGWTPEEEALLSLYHEDKTLTSRRMAEEYLVDHPKSIPAHFVVGAVLRQEEGSHASAMFHLGKARELYESRNGTSGAGSGWELHREIIVATATTAGEMGEHDYKLLMLDYHDSLYDPNMIGEHAWPLMKLGRYEDARKYAMQAIQSGDAWQKTLGLNGLCALESEAGNRDAAFKACVESLEHRKLDAESDFTVAAFNASISALSALDFKRAEDLAVDGIGGSAQSTANPWMILLGLYISQGKGESAAGAALDLQRWRGLQPPHLRDQNRAETDAAFATLLLAVGETDKGMEVITRALDFPDRRGSSSGDAAQALGGQSLLRIAMRRTATERRAEEAASWTLPGRALAATSSLAPDPADWEDRATVIGVLTNTRRLRSTLRVYVSGGLDGVPVWLLGDLIDVVGAGVVHTALEDVRAMETSDEVVPYYDAIEAEVALAQGDRTRALDLAERALDELPRSEKLLAGRVAAIGARAARGLGQSTKELSLLETAMERDPGAIRRLGLALPAVVETRGDDAGAAKAAKMIARSPRLRVSSSGFLVTVSGSGEEVRTCLSTPTGRQLSCGAATLPEPEEDEEPVTLSTTEYARLVALAFHDHAFAMPLGTKNIDLRSLDGGTVLSTEQARQRMESLLDSIRAEDDRDGSP